MGEDSGVDIIVRICVWEEKIGMGSILETDIEEVSRGNLEGEREGSRKCGGEFGGREF